MKKLSTLRSMIPPVIFSLGVLCLTGFTPMNQEDVVAPYPYQNHPRIDPLLQNQKHQKFYEMRLERSPDSGLDLAALASLLVAESNLTGDLSKIDEAEVKAKKSIEVLPVFNNTPKITLAKVSEARHLFKDAINQAKAIYLDDNRNKGALSTLVTAYLGNGRPAEALPYADQLVLVSPGTESFTLRALTYLAQGNDTEALKDFHQALKSEGPGDRLQSAWIRTLIGRHFYRTGNIQAAEAYTNSALAVSENYHVALAQKADIEALRGNQDEAIRIYQKAYKERQEPPYLLAQANLLESSGETKKAETLRKKAETSIRTEIEETPYGHYNELSQVLVDRENPAQHEEAIAAALKDVEQRNTSESYYLLSEAYLNSGKIPEARSAIQEALKSGELNCEYQAMAAKIETGQSDYPECPQF
jgi:tetratricopeptide (TPR) repeat protein